MKSSLLSCGALFALSGFTLSLMPAVQGQPVGGVVSEVELPSSRAAGARVSGFYYDNQYYIAFSVSQADDFHHNYGPAVFYGETAFGTNTDGTTDTSELIFKDAQKVNLAGFPISNGPYDTWHMAAALSSQTTPYVFWTNTKDNEGDVASLSVVQMYPSPQAGAAPTFSKVVPAPGDIVNALDNVVDVAIAPYADDLYLIYARGGDYNDIAVVRFSDDQGEFEFEALIDLPFDWVQGGQNGTIASIDAANVTLDDGSEAILVAAVTMPDKNSFWIMAWLWDPSAPDTQVIPHYTLYNPDSVAIENYIPTIRVAYGSLPGLIPANAATLAVYFLQDANNTAGWMHQVTALTFPDSLPGTVQQDLNVGLNGWISLSGSPFLGDPLWWTAFTAPMPVPASSNSNDSGYQPVHQFLNLGFIGPNDALSEHNNTMISNLSLILTPTLNELQDFTPPTWNTVDSDEQAELINSWNLLGVIAGFPPILKDTEISGNPPSLVIVDYGTSDTTTSSIESQTSVGVSVGASYKFISASAGYSHATKSGTSESATTKISVTTGIGNPDPDRTYTSSLDQGYLVVSIPSLQQGLYEVHAFDGTDLNMTTLSMWINGVDISFFPFSLSDPSSSMGTHTPQALLDWPVVNGQTISWPQLDDVKSWSEPISTWQSGYDSNYLNSGGQTVGITSGAITTMTLNQDNTQGYSSEVSNSFNSSVSAIFGFDMSMSMTSSVSTTFGSETGITINYPSPVGFDSKLSIQVQPILTTRDTSSSDVPNWIPTVFQNSAPWLLTWRVTDYPLQDDRGQSAFLGEYYATPEQYQSGWRYFFDFMSWIYQSGNTVGWSYWSNFGDWLWIDLDSTPGNLYLYRDSNATWYYSSAGIYPWLYNFSTNTWETAPL